MENHVSIYIDLQRCKLHTLLWERYYIFWSIYNFCTLQQMHHFAICSFRQFNQKTLKIFLHLKWLIDYPKKVYGGQNIDFWNSNLIWTTIIIFSRYYIYVHLFHISIISKEISENESSKHNYRVSKSSKYLAHSY